MVHKITSVANFQFDYTQHENATKFAIITTSWSIGISELIINLPPKFNRSNTVAERSKESEFSAKIIECEITREENQFLFLGSRMCFSPSKSSNLAPSAMQKKINTEFTHASDEKCTSESVPPDKWQDEHVNNEMSTGTTFYTLVHFWSISVLCFLCGVEGIVYFRWTFQVFRGVVQKKFQSINFEKTVAPHLWSHGKISWNLQNVYNCEALDW